MLKKLQESVHFFTSNSLLIFLISISVVVPSLIVVSSLNFLLGTDLPGRVLRVIRWILSFRVIEGVLGLITIGSTIHIIYMFNKGQTAGYLEAISIGLSKWGKLTLATIIFTLVIISGYIVTILLREIFNCINEYIAVCIEFFGFIISLIVMIILSIQYALIDFVVVLEETGPSKWLKRAAQLASGRRWEIFSMLILVNLVFYIITYAFQSMPVLSDNVLLTDSLSLILGSIQSIFITAVLFLFYWESREKQEERKRKLILSKAWLEYRIWRIVKFKKRKL